MLQHHLSPHYRPGFARSYDNCCGFLLHNGFDFIFHYDYEKRASKAIIRLWTLSFQMKNAIEDKLLSNVKEVLICSLHCEVLYIFLLHLISNWRKNFPLFSFILKSQGTSSLVPRNIKNGSIKSAWKTAYPSINKPGSTGNFIKISPR